MSVSLSSSAGRWFFTASFWVLALSYVVLASGDSRRHRRQDGVPSFENEPYIVRNLTSASPNNTKLLKVTARGAGLILYSVDNTALLRVEPLTGQVFTNVDGRQLLSASELNFTVFAVNQDYPDRLASTVVLIAGNRRPKFSDHIYSADVHENAVGGSLVAAVVAQDADTDAVSYFILQPNAAADDVSSEYQMFTINQQTGVIRVVSRQFSFTKELYSFTVVALDTHGDNDTARVDVHIVDENDHRPEFPNCDDYHPTVAENRLRGEYVVQVEATDADKGANAEIVYSLVTSPGTRLRDFKINNVTGRLTTFRPFDRDDPANEKELRVLVKATDRGSPALEGTCSFVVRVRDLNDNDPLFDKVRYSESIPKNTELDTVIMRISAADEDSDANAELVYSLNASKAEDDGFFSIDSRTGIITLTRSLADIPLETVFNLRGIASDRGEPSRSSDSPVTITIKDSNTRPPSFVQRPNHTYYLPETYRDTETPIAHVKAVSNTPGSPSIYYEIVYGRLEQTNGLRTFLLEEDGLGGAYVKYGSSNSMDYEHIQYYNITVLATTDEQTSAEVAFNIELMDRNDESPIFFDVDRVVVQENADPGTFVVVATAHDKDGTAPNNRVSYGFDPESEEARLFNIDSETGRITTRVRFDREDSSRPSPFYTVTVIAEDGAPSDIRRGDAPNKENRRITVEIGDENDNPPSFNNSRIYRSSVDEDSDIGTKIFDVAATDPDSASKIKYEITGGNVGAAFGVDPETGSVFVKKSLDYETSVSYTITVTASDGKYEASHPVYIDVNNVNDLPPVFDQQMYSLKMREGNMSSEPLVTVRAIDPDPVGRPSIVYQLSGPGTGSQHSEDNIFTITNNGEIRVQKTLDRDEGTGGREVWELTVLASDDGGKGDIASVPFRLTLTDINDNVPYLIQSESSRPVINENINFKGISISVEADDFDDHQKNGPPYTFRLDPDAPLDIQSKFQVQSISGQNRAVIRPLVTFDREQQKQYSIPVLVGDNAGADPRSMTGTSLFSIIIGDENDNDMKEGSSAIQVFNFEGKMPDTVIGRVYVDDPDDWDLPDKTFKWVEGEEFRQFLLDSESGNITMRRGTLNGTYSLKFEVFDKKFQSTVNAYVTVVVKLLPRVAVVQSGSIRLKGVTPGEFISPPDKNTPSMYARLIDHLAEMFGTARENVDVFGVQDSGAGRLDVRYSAHGSPYYSSQKMDGIASRNVQQLEKILGLKIDQISINDCIYESTCRDSCFSTLEIYDNEVYKVQTNTSSIIGVRTELKYHCGECEPQLDPQICLNDGRWNSELATCECSAGYDGPNCEGLNINFEGDGYTWFPPLSSCNSSTLRFDVTTADDKSLIIYNGPATHTNREVTDYFAVDLSEGRLRVFMNYGSGTVVVSPGMDVGDGRKHHVQIDWHSERVTVTIDHCFNDTQCQDSKRAAGSGGEKNSFLNVAAPLQLGGSAIPLEQISRLMGWSKFPVTNAFSGCIHNLTFLDKVFDLSHPSYGEGYSSLCSALSPATAVIYPTSSFIAIIASCLVLLIMLLLVVVVCRRRRVSSLYKEPMDELRDTIINYDDEGGGEKDQTAFDLSVLQVPNANGIPLGHTPVRDFIDDNKEKVDADGKVWPPDDVRNYAYEGSGSLAGSLSSINSGTTDSDLDFDYLKDLDPRFRKLADMYGGDGDDDDEVPAPSGRPSSMAGESWC